MFISLPSLTSNMVQTTLQKSGLVDCGNGKEERGEKEGEAAF